MNDPLTDPWAWIDGLMQIARWIALVIALLVTLALSAGAFL